jgi:2'-5' RNA ligase
VRLFFAIELPDDVRTLLGTLRSEDARDYRWVDPALMHLTLAFLGDQPEDQLSQLERVGHEAARQSQRGTLRLGAAGHFGSARAPRVLWVDIRGDVDKLLALQTRLANGLREHHFPAEEREFRAHITLARRRERATGGAPRGWPPNVERVSFGLEQLTLMQSRLSPKGPTYTAVSQFKIGG